jgi:hypothetical protein
LGLRPAASDRGCRRSGRAVPSRGRSRAGRSAGLRAGTVTHNPKDPALVPGSGWPLPTHALTSHACKTWCGSEKKASTGEPSSSYSISLKINQNKTNPSPKVRDWLPEASHPRISRSEPRALHCLRLGTLPPADSSPALGRQPCCRTKGPAYRSLALHRRLLPLWRT